MHQAVLDGNMQADFVDTFWLTHVPLPSGNDSRAVDETIFFRLRQFHSADGNGWTCIVVLLARVGKADNSEVALLRYSLQTVFQCNTQPFYCWAAFNVTKCAASLLGWYKIFPVVKSKLSKAHRVLCTHQYRDSVTWQSPCTVHPFNIVSQ